MPHLSINNDVTLYPTREGDMQWIVAAHKYFPVLLEMLRDAQDYVPELLVEVTDEKNPE